MQQLWTSHLDVAIRSVAHDDRIPGCITVSKGGFGTNAASRAPPREYIAIQAPPQSHYLGHIQMRYLDYLANPDREKSPFPSNGRGKPCVKQSNRRLVNRDSGVAWRLKPLSQ